MLRSWALLDSTDGQGKTALHYAAEAGHLEATRALLTCGVYTAVVDAFGLSCLQIPASEGHEHVVLLLLRGGADPNYPTTIPLHVS